MRVPPESLVLRFRQSRLEPDIRPEKYVMGFVCYRHTKLQPAVLRNLLGSDLRDGHDGLSVSLSLVREVVTLVIQGELAVFNDVKEKPRHEHLHS